MGVSQAQCMRLGSPVHLYHIFVKNLLLQFFYKIVLLRNILKTVRMSLLQL